MKKRGIAAIIPLYLFTVLLVLLPMAYVLALAFLEKGTSFGVSDRFTLANFAALLEPANVTIFVRSLRVAALTTVLTLLIGYPFALAMAGRSKRQRSLLLLLVIVPFWTSALLRTYGWMIFLRANGLLNELLRRLSLIDKPIKFLYNEGATLFGMVYSFLPFLILPVFTALEKQDGALREAARDLGARPFKAFWTITFPLTMPGVISGCTMVFVPSIGAFFISDLLGGGADMLLGNLINHYLHGGRNWPLGAALSMVLVAMTAVTLGIYRRFSGGEELGVF